MTWWRKVFGDKRDPRVQLSELFGGEVSGGSAPAPALAWGREALSRAGVDPQDEVAAIGALRTAEPRLT